MLTAKAAARAMTRVVAHATTLAVRRARRIVAATQRRIVEYLTAALALNAHARTRAVDAGLNLARRETPSRIGNHPLHHQQSQRDRQVVERPLFANISRCKIDQRPPTRKHIPRVHQRGLHPLDRLLHRRVRQPDHGVLHLLKVRSVVKIDLHLAGKCVNALEQVGSGTSKHGAIAYRTKNRTQV